MAATVRGSKQGLEIIDQARKRKGWSATSTIWWTEAQTSAATLKRFRRGLPVNQDTFGLICKAVGIENWEIIAEQFPQQNLPKFSPQVSNHLSKDLSVEEIDLLVDKVRIYFDQNIQQQYKTLCTFNLFYNPVRIDIDTIYVQCQLNSSENFDIVSSVKQSKLWNEVVLEESRLLILGKPGGGKTTLLQQLAVNYDKVGFQKRLIPVFISLKSVIENVKSNNQINLLDYVWSNYLNKVILFQELEALLKDGRILFLLDGLDEVKEEFIRVVNKEIHNLVEQFRDNRFVLSCRREFSAYKSKSFGNFKSYTLASFEWRQVTDFINKWFEQASLLNAKKSLFQANQLIEKLALRENKRIQELANTPLLLHLICLVFQERGGFPLRQIDLYREGIELLLLRWNEFNEREQTNLSRSIAILNRA